MPANCHASSSVTPVDTRPKRTSMAMGLGRRDTTSSTFSHHRAQSTSSAGGPSEGSPGVPTSTSHHTLANIRHSFAPRRKSSDIPQSPNGGPTSAVENAIHLPPPHAMSHLDYSSGLFPMTDSPSGTYQGTGQGIPQGSRPPPPSQGMTTGRSPNIEEESPFEDVRAGLKSASVMWDFEKSDDDEVTVRSGF